jgi:uncharacterized protein YbjT (DUF2867 family)
MSIAITTPTGHIGSRVAQLVIQGGARPILIVRDPARLAPEVRAASDVRVADQNDPAAIIEATQRATALFWLNPPDFVSDDPNGAYIEKGRAAAKAIQENGIARVVFLSSVGAERRRGFGLIDGLGQTEELLDATGASVVHLRAGFFFTNFLMQLDGLKKGVYAAPLPAETRFAFVDPRDIGEVAAARLLDSSWTGRHTQGVHGPEDLTTAEAVAAVSEATGHPIAFVEVPDEAFHANLLAAGLNKPTADGMLQMYQGLRSGFVPEDKRTLLTTTPTTLGAWAYANLRGLLNG